jgi:hypothetical protein
VVMMGTMAPTEKLGEVCKVCGERKGTLELVWMLLNVKQMALITKLNHIMLASRFTCVDIQYISEGIERERPN